MSSALSQVYKVWGMISEQGASQVALVVRNPAANAGEVRDTSSIPELGTREEKKSVSRPDSKWCICISI